MKYFSMFSGIGGFELGIQQSHPEWQCVGYSEVDKYAIKIYETHFPGHKNFGDATRIDPNTIPDFDLLCGGFPCQAFSISGKRAGFQDARGTLFYEIARIARVKKPSYMLLENVKGLLSHDNGNTFAAIIQIIDELGYDCEWCLYNSFFFNAGQRQRVYIFATYRECKFNNGERELETTPLYACFSERFRNKDSEREQESMRSSGRIIRTFAKLPDWLDSWDPIYGEEEMPRECRNG